MLGRGLEKARDLAAARKMLAGGPQHDDADAGISIERLEHRAQFLALGHRNDVERWPVEDHVGALPLGIQLQAEAVETFGEPWHQPRRIAHAIILAGDEQAAQDLADRRFRDFGDKHVLARALVIGEARTPAPGVECVGLDRAAALDESGDPLAPALVPQAGDGHLGDGRMQ